jgi:acetoacetyl-CoA synthetase
VEAYDANGRPVTDEVGELVLTEPMPSMPLRFWGDKGGQRYRTSYFDTYPGAWRHGDWVKITADGRVVIYGRSDATLNRGGVRIGTSELYRVIEELPDVLDSLAVDGENRLYLFVVLAEDVHLDDGLRTTIREQVRTHLSPRHVPDEIVAVADIPRTLNGKKLEVPVKRVLLGEAWERAVSADAMANPEAMEPFVALAIRARQASGEASGALRPAAAERPGGPSARQGDGT